MQGVFPPSEGGRAAWGGGGGESVYVDPLAAVKDVFRNLEEYKSTLDIIIIMLIL